MEKSSSINETLYHHFYKVDGKQLVTLSENYLGNKLHGSKLTRNITVKGKTLKCTEALVVECNYHHGMLHGLYKTYMEQYTNNSSIGVKIATQETKHYVYGRQEGECIKYTIPKTLEEWKAGKLMSQTIYKSTTTEIRNYQYLDDNECLITTQIKDDKFNLIDENTAKCLIADIFTTNKYVLIKTIHHNGDGKSYVKEVTIFDDKKDPEFHPQYTEYDEKNNIIRTCLIINKEKRFDGLFTRVGEVLVTEQYTLGDNYEPFKEIIVGTYLNGEYHKTIEKYFNNQLIESTFYNKGIRDGITTKWRNKHKIYQACYSNGVLEGVETEWFYNGSLLDRKYHVSGHQVPRTQYIEYTIDVDNNLQQIGIISDLTTILLGYVH